jgi:hypothetical protein
VKRLCIRNSRFSSALKDHLLEIPRSFANSGLFAAAPFDAERRTIDVSRATTAAVMCAGRI